jgi:hypothetical protein
MTLDLFALSGCPAAIIFLLRSNFQPRAHNKEHLIGRFNIAFSTVGVGGSIKPFFRRPSAFLRKQKVRALGDRWLSAVEGGGHESSFLGSFVPIRLP